MKYIPITLTKEMWDLAEKRCKNMPKYKDSLNNGKDKIIGAMGVIISEIYYKGSTFADTSEYDIIYNNKTIEIKSRTLEKRPSPYVEFLLPKLRKQNSDYYLFCGISRKNNIGWILGYLPRDEVFEKAQFIEAGVKVGNLDETKKPNYLLNFGQFKQADSLRFIV